MRDEETHDPVAAATGKAWPVDFAWGEAVPAPDAWQRPGIVMFFNLACAGCVSRGVPFLEELHGEYGDDLEILAVHTSRGHRPLPRAQVLPQLQRFAREFARLPFPVAFDLDGAVAGAWGTEGTPHWLVFAAGGELVRSIFGSQDNARQRLRYLLEERLGR